VQVLLEPTFRPKIEATCFPDATSQKMAFLIYKTDRTAVDLFQTEIRELSPFHNVQTSPEAQRPFYTMGSLGGRGVFPVGASR
jgi:hypothetical protein